MSVHSGQSHWYLFDPFGEGLPSQTLMAELVDDESELGEVRDPAQLKNMLHNRYELGWAIYVFHFGHSAIRKNFISVVPERKVVDGNNS